jgi:N utilization substance protein B
MSARSKARKRALDILYAAELRGQDPVVELDAAIADGEGPTNPYTGALVRGVAAHRERIDELLTSYSQAWTLDRMPAVDRNALRIGAFELLYADAHVMRQHEVEKNLLLAVEARADKDLGLCSSLFASEWRERVGHMG